MTGLQRLGSMWVVAVLVLGAVLMGTVPARAGDAEASGDVTVLITGANRGIGLEFARQYAARGWHVIGTARKPDEATELKALAAASAKITIETLDVLTWRSRCAGGEVQGQAGRHPVQQRRGTPGRCRTSSSPRT